MFVDTPVLPGPALHWSAMFPGDGYATGCYFSLLWSEEHLSKIAFYKHRVPTGRGSGTEKPRRENKKLQICFTDY